MYLTILNVYLYFLYFQGPAQILKITRVFYSPLFTSIKYSLPPPEYDVTISSFSLKRL